MSDENLDVVVLLTATLDPKGMSLLRRKNPRVRERDYIQTILELPDAYRIVFCENSGYPLDAIRDAFAQKTNVYELLQFEEESSSFERGKGYGEMGILMHALEHSSLIRSASYVMKITGRYRVQNLTALLKPLTSAEEIYVLADIQPETRYVYSGVFAAQASFIERYLAPLRNQLDDLKGYSMEIALRDAINAARADGHVIEPFPERPRVEGISGTWNAPLDPENPNGIGRSVAKVCIIARAYWRAGTKRVRVALRSLF